MYRSHDDAWRRNAFWQLVRVLRLRSGGNRKLAEAENVTALNERLCRMEAGRFCIFVGLSHLLRYKPSFVEPDCRWAVPAELQAEVDALQAAANLPRPRRPGGRYGKRPRVLAIEDGAVEEEEEVVEEVLLRVCKRVPFVLCATDLSLSPKRKERKV